MILKPQPHCPIADHLLNINILSRDMLKTVRQLRRDLSACQQCPSFDECPIIRDFNSQVRSAIAEIDEELNLAEAVIRS
jgi:hypothetical protein